MGELDDEVHFSGRKMDHEEIRRAVIKHPAGTIVAVALLAFCAHCRESVPVAVMSSNTLMPDATVRFVAATMGIGNAVNPPLPPALTAPNPKIEGYCTPWFPINKVEKFRPEVKTVPVNASCAFIPPVASAAVLNDMSSTIHSPIVGMAMVRCGSSA